MNTPTTSIPVWLGALGIFLFATIWFLLPLIPALVEWQKGTDATPLRVVREYDGNVRFFAQGFLSFLNKQFGGDALGTLREVREDRVGSFPDGSQYLLTPGTGTLSLDRREQSRRTVDKVIACSGNMNLPDELYFAREILVLKTLVGGDGNIYRAIRGESNVSLGSDSVVLRWLHAQGRVETGTSNSLYGRASSEDSIHLENGSFFQRLHAPVLEFGRPPAGVVLPPLPETLKHIDKLPGEYNKESGRHLAAGNIEIDGGSYYRGDVVTLDNFVLGAGSRIDGSVKSRKSMRIKRGCYIEGSLVSEGDLFIEDDCFVKGPIISEGRIVISPGARIGTPQAPTTVSAPDMDVAPGVIAYGSVWARENGHVRIPRNDAH